MRACYERVWRDELSVEHDASGLRAESNVLRHRPVGRVVARHDGRQDEALARLRLAAAVTGVPLVESDARAVDEDELVASLRTDDRVRLLAEPGEALLRALVESAVWFDTSPPLAHGRVELLKWVREQSVSTTLHRHGRLPTGDHGATPTA